jgi:phosphatidate cytidylyltransferase
MSSRLWDLPNAFAHPMTTLLTTVVGGLLAFAIIIIFVLDKLGKLKPSKRDELRKRIVSWLVLIVLIMLPILAGPWPTIAGITLLSLFCFGEFARATGLFRERLICALVVAGILFVAFAALDNWYGFYSALAILSVAVIAGVAILPDRPKGYTQRVALGVFGFMFFGYGLGYLSYMTNDPNYRPILLLLILTTELNDVFAYVTGHLFGKRKMAPNTSPNKTMGGAVGALVLTAATVILLGKRVFAGTDMAQTHLLLTLGIIIAAVGQLGDLMLSSIKRDVGVKDLGAVIPGHGGFLDRFDSLVLVTPAVFHFVNYYVGIGVGQPIRIITTGG